MNNLQKAKELREKYNKAVENMKESLSIKDFLNAKFYLNMAHYLFKEIKELKSKIEAEGCGREHPGNMGNIIPNAQKYIITAHECREPFYCDGKHIPCGDCSEAIKICEEILK